MKVLMSLMIAAIWASTAMAGPVLPEDKEVIQFESKLGVVTFAHKKHSDMTITQCTTCHHTFKPEAGEKVKACHECHDKKKQADIPDIKTAVHLRCQGCHQYTIDQGGVAGPTKKECKLCHIKQ